MITGTICRHSHLFLLYREALWPDESKMLPASNKCSTMYPVNKNYKCSVPENGNACHKLSQPQIEPNCKLHSSQREYTFCCFILPLVQQAAEDWQPEQQRQQLRIPCKVGPRHFCASGFIRSGPGLCENAVPVLQDFAPCLLKLSSENENRIQSGGINIAAPPESNSWGNWKRGEGFRKYFTQTHPPTRKCPLRITNTSTAKVGLHELLIIPCYVTRKNDWREGGPWISYALGRRSSCATILYEIVFPHFHFWLNGFLSWQNGRQPNCSVSRALKSLTMTKPSTKARLEKKFWAPSILMTDRCVGSEIMCTWFEAKIF